jgi:tetratricopeptide (TPR) repeat protein
MVLVAALLVMAVLLGSRPLAAGEGDAATLADSGVPAWAAERFQLASELARQGKSGEALKAYDLALTPSGEANARRGLPWTLVLEVTLRQAFCLMDLGRFAEARALLNSPKFRPHLGKLTPLQLFTYYYCFGNILGNLGEVYEAAEKFRRAVTIAGTVLQDPQKEYDSWFWAHSWVGKHHQWSLLEELAVAAIKSGTAAQSEALMDLGEKSRCLALMGKGKPGPAIDAASRVRRYYQSMQNPEKTAEWTTFLLNLNSPRAGEPPANVPAMIAP